MSRLWVIWVLVFITMQVIIHFMVIPVTGVMWSLLVGIITGAIWGYLNPSYFRRARERRNRKSKRGFE